MAETNPIVLRAGYGVLTTPGGQPRIVEALFRNEKRTSVSIVTPQGVETLKTEPIPADASSGRLVFTAKDVKYTWRPLREADGIWLSKYQVPIPVKAIPGVIPVGEIMNTTETLDAYSTDDSPYVLGVVYENDLGKWVRSGGTWVATADDDETYAGMERIRVADEKAREFLSLYDQNYVTVSDAAKFEAASDSAGE